MLGFGMTYNSVQEMLDEIDPELAEEFREHMKRPSVRFRKWQRVNWLLFKIRLGKIFRKVD